MRAIITVVASRSMPGRFSVQSSANKDRRGVVFAADVRGEEAAAAQALTYAMGCKSGYAIIAPTNVAKHIPDDMRSRE